MNYKPLPIAINTYFNKPAKNKFFMQLLLFVLLSSTTLFAEVSQILSFNSFMKYDKNSYKSSGYISGLYYNTGTLSYLSEFTYTHTDIRYRYITQNLVQDDYAMAYSHYFINSSYKIGVHASSTSDKDLQNGVTLLLDYNRWKWFNAKQKISYGVGLYQSYYANAKDLKDNNRSVNIVELSANVGYYHIFKEVANYSALRLNYEDVKSYDDHYLFFEFQDIVYYKKFEVALEYMQGSMRTGILNGGLAVYNSKDLLKRKLKIGVKYPISLATKIEVSYAKTNYDEFKNRNLNSSTFSFNINYAY